MKDVITINKDLLKTFIFDFIFNHTIEVNNPNKHISIYDGFIYYNDNSKGLNEIRIIYKVNYHNTSESKEQMENYNFFTDRVDMTLGYKEDYTREECKQIAETMYLTDENAVATILKLLNPNTTF